MLSARPWKYVLRQGMNVDRELLDTKHVEVNGSNARLVDLDLNRRSAVSDSKQKQSTTASVSDPFKDQQR